MMVFKSFNHARRTFNLSLQIDKVSLYTPSIGQTESGYYQDGTETILGCFEPPSIGQTERLTFGMLLLSTSHVALSLPVLGRLKDDA
jgi:hypothetical protein